MKKTLLFASLIISCFSFAQKKLITITNTYYDITGTITDIDSTANTYNSWIGSLTEFKADLIDNGGVFEISTPEQDSRFLVHCDASNHYYGSGYPLTFDAATTNTLTNEKVTLSEIGSNEKNLYDYNSQGKMTLQVRQYLNGVNWETFDSTVYKYDALGNTTLIQRFNPFNVPSIVTVDSMFYNAGTNLLNKASSYYYNSSISALTLSQETFLTYTGTNIEFLDLYQDNGAGSVDWILRVNYSYTGNISTGFQAYLVANNTPTSIVYATGTFNTNAQNLYSEYNLTLGQDTLFKYTFDYDAQGFLTQYTDYESDNNGGIFVASKTKYTFQNTAEIINIVDATVSVFPNPTTNELTIQSASPIESVQILNVNGQVLIDQKSNKVELNHLANGTYIIRGNTESGSFSKKIVKE